MKAQEQIEKLRTLQESFDNLAENVNTISNKVVSLGDGSVMLNDVAEGKKQIADAINYKGGEASGNSTFTQLAEDIKDIPNFDQWARLAGVLAGNSYYKNHLQGHNENVEAGNLTKITDPFGTFTRINNYAFQCWDLLEVIELPYTEFIGIRGFDNCTNLKVIKLNSIINLSEGNVFNNNIRLEVFYAPLLSNITSSNVFQGTNELKNIVFGTLNIMTKAFFYSPKNEMRNITIGQGTDIDLPFQLWTATNVILEGQSGIDELNENLYNNLLTKLYDHSEDGQTRTLRLGWLAHVSQKNIDYANSKGWTLTT